MLGSMAAEVEKLVTLCKEFHELSDNELPIFVPSDERLHGLPHLQQTAAHLSSLKVGESLSQLYVYTRSFKLHVDWLKTAKENVSLTSQSAEGASTHLLLLSKLLAESLHQVSREVPQPPTPSPSLPVVSTAFDVLQFSVEIANRMRVFCNWTKRVLHYLQRLCHGH